MLDGSITYVIVILWGVWLLRGDRIENANPGKILLSLIFAFYVSRLVATTFFPFPTEAAIIEQNQSRGAAGFGPGNNFTPFATVIDASGSEATFINQIVGNFLLLFPLGLLAPLLWPRFRRRRAAIGLVVATTVAIEVSQLGISQALGYTYRSFDVDDLWLNAAGGILGVLIATMLFRASLPETDATDEESASRQSSPPTTIPQREWVDPLADRFPQPEWAPRGSRETVPYRSEHE